MDNKERLLQEIAKCELIISLESHEGFIHFLNYFRDSAKIADDSWHNFVDMGSENFLSLRASKIAALNVLSYIDTVKFDLENFKRELEDLNNE